MVEYGMMIEYYYYPTRTGASCRGFYIRCKSIYEDPLGNRMGCSLSFGHSGPHQCGFSAYVEWKDSENCKDYCIHCFDRDVGGWDLGWGSPEIQYGCDVDGARVELEDVCRFEPSRFEVAKDENIL